MSARSKMKLGTRLALGFGLVALLIIVLSVVSLIGLRQIADVVHAQNVARTDRLERLYRAREALNQTGIAARNAYIFTDAGGARAELDLIDRQKAIYLDELQRLAPLFEGNADFARARAGLLAMAEELKRPRGFREAGRMQEYGEFLVNECTPLRRRIVADIDVVIKSTQSHVDARSVEAEQVLSQSLTVIVALSAAALLLGAGVGILLIRSILREMGGEPGDVRAVAARIASGDLNVTVPTRAGDASSVMHAMKQMRDNLATIVGQVRTGTDAIATASAQVAAGSQDLSARTEQQAGSLEETACSVDELTSTVKRNAENADQANALAADASDVASKGGTLIDKVVGTMGEINESAMKIAGIINVIDGIAFQTNILALNAAVEAARAGEQGRGFAVVAAEVRTLAQRSASAAREIKTLIGDSVERVESGSKLVHDAGSTMREIVERVGRVAGIMAGIAAASREQTSGIEQINQAVSKMDEGTRQNAALVEEATAAAEAMQDQAASLAQVVSVFKLDPGPGRPAPAWNA